MPKLVDRVTTSLQSPRVLVTMLAVAVGAFVVWWFARRRGARMWVAVAIAAIPVVVASAVLVAPYFRARELVEALPSPTAGGSPTGGEASSPAAALIRRADLRGLGGHSAKGSVVLHRLADGGHLLQFESVDIEGTPTPFVYVVPGKGRDRPGGDKLGKLKAERGTFHYAVPEPDGTVTVLVWCERFAVPIAGATLDLA